MLVDKIKNRTSGIILYGITPPKRGNTDEKIAAIANRQIQRLKDLDLDGLVLYDIQDEQARTSELRPFPFIETLDALDYSQKYLQELDIPRVIYRAVAKYSPEELKHFVTQNPAEKYLTVFVGAASKSQKVSLSLSGAYGLKAKSESQMLLGGVTIPERHQKSGDEHLRVISKMSQGCSFFVSQGVYDVNASKNLLSEYYYHAKENDIPLAPILFTLTPCGSQKTLQFMKWLGISIPKWLENELMHSKDILQQSLDYSEQSWLELKQFADQLGIPIGCNIESVATRKVEIEASIELVKRVKASMV
ncbi:MAG: 5,10-methylenetetrahydrofolate reductase [Alteromonadaceae bacterium]|nr:MAG: 5,10-methylenetetrahydrofolate reductase [Alteromonadaceae bacterium]